VLAKPGDVIVVDGKCDLSCALTGALMAAHAKKAGIAGFVIDGAVRDTEECSKGGFPDLRRFEQPEQGLERDLRFGTDKTTNPRRSARRISSMRS
jgi:regulator of RNase E activity RraA